jgi:hypothetical protein
LNPLTERACFYPRSLDRPVCAIHAHHFGHEKLEQPKRQLGIQTEDEEEEKKKDTCAATFPVQAPDMKIHQFSEVASSYEWNKWGGEDQPPLDLHNGSHFFDKWSPVFGVNILGFKSCKGPARLAGFRHATGLMAGLMDWDMDGKPNCEACQAEFSTGRGTVVMQGVTEAAGIGVDKLKNQFESEILGGIPEACRPPSTKPHGHCDGDEPKGGGFSEHSLGCDETPICCLPHIDPNQPNLDNGICELVQLLFDEGYSPAFPETFGLGGDHPGQPTQYGQNLSVAGVKRGSG